MLKPLALALLAVLGGAAFAEAMLRLAADPYLDYASLFVPGPYCQDAELGFSALCPNRRGIMHVPGTDRYVPYGLNELGVRGPFRGGPAGPQPLKTVAIVGGQSQGFGFGLKDAETFASVAAQSSCGSVEVHSIAMLGVFNPVTWHLFERDFLSQHKVDHIILAVYSKIPSGWDRDLDSYRDEAGRTALLGGWTFDVPRWLPEPLRQSQLVVRGIRRLRGISAYFARGSAAAAAVELAPSTRPPSPTGRDFIRAVAKQAAARGAKFSVVMLPLLADDADLRTGLDGIRVLDLGSVVTLPRDAGQLFPDGHFNPHLASFLGSRLGREICDVNFPGASHPSIAGDLPRSPAN